MEADLIIKLDGLKKHYPIGGGHFTALNGINLDFARGEFAALIGPSGSGKTTMINIIGSLDMPSEGRVTFMGYSIGELNAKSAALIRSSKMGFIFQTYNLLPVYTVFENVELPLLLLGIEKSTRKKMVRDAIEWVGLTDKIKSKPPQLSGGESQRVAIARAMVKKPAVVFADEPTANLDAANSHHILQTMEKLNRELQTTFIFATHDEKVISYVRRRIYLSDGLVVRDERVAPQRTEV
ncbi:MAG: ABC transporter ATP-binding protein [Bacteroidia bacterium]|nr:MAG: ABC transporter ATP-binding protein [Bacteroidia bacterium]